MVVVKFIGDAEHTEIPLSFLDKFAMAFRKLYKRRYEKIYVKAVIMGTEKFLKWAKMDLETFTQLAGLPLGDLHMFMSQDNIRSYIEMPLEKPRATWNSLRRTIGDGGGNGSSGSSSSDLQSSVDKYKAAEYEIDPEIFKEIKKAGLRGDHRIL